MLSQWTKILPFFVVQWLARALCEKFVIQGQDYVSAYKGVLVKAKRPPTQKQRELWLTPPPF